LRASVAEKVRVSTQRLARLGGDRQGEVLDPLADQLSGAVEHGGTLVLGEVGRPERFHRRLGGLVDQRCVALCDAAGHGAVVGAAYLVPLAGLAPLARSEELVVWLLHLHRRVEQAETPPSRTG